jgi:hypothetical protein
MPLPREWECCLCCLQWLLLLLHVRQAVQALYMPYLAAVYVEAQKSANIKRLEAHLADNALLTRTNNILGQASCRHGQAS